MESKKVFLLLPIIFVITVSGCIIPGTGIELPGIPDVFNFGVKVERADVIVIRSLNAYPDKITADQELRLVAYIQNRGKETVGRLNVGGQTGIKVSLYDHCVGLFDDIQVTCPGSKQDDTGCVINELLPMEIKKIDWILKPSQVELETQCNLKISVTYPYNTTSITTIHFISQNELQRQLEEGSYKPRGSLIVQGEGPIKALVSVLDQQPIPITENKDFKVVLEVSNRGSGFVARNEDGKDKERRQLLFLEKLDYGGDQRENCNFREKDYRITLIRGKSSVTTCTLKKPDQVEKELTKTLEITVKYLYEIRKEKKVTITKSVGALSSQ